MDDWKVEDAGAWAPREDAQSSSGWQVEDNGPLETGAAQPTAAPEPQQPDNPPALQERRPGILANASPELRAAMTPEGIAPGITQPSGIPSDIRNKEALDRIIQAGATGFGDEPIIPSAEERQQLSAKVITALQNVGLAPTEKNLNLFNSATGLIGNALADVVVPAGVTALDLTGRIFMGGLGALRQTGIEALTEAGLDENSAKQIADDIAGGIQIEAQRGGEIGMRGDARMGQVSDYEKGAGAFSSALADTYGRPLALTDQRPGSVRPERTVEPPIAPEPTPEQRAASPFGPDMVKPGDNTSPLGALAVEGRKIIAKGSAPEAPGSPLAAAAGLRPNVPAAGVPPAEPAFGEPGWSMFSDLPDSNEPADLGRTGSMTPSVQGSLPSEAAAPITQPGRRMADGTWVPWGQPATGPVSSFSTGNEPPDQGVKPGYTEPSIPSQVEPEPPRGNLLTPRKPMGTGVDNDTSVLQNLKRLGGVRVRNADGDLTKEGQDFMAAIGDAKRPGLINNKTGVTPDRAREAFEQNGWFSGSGTRGQDIQDLYDLIDKETREGRQYHPESDAGRKVQDQKIANENEQGLADIRDRAEHAGITVQPDWGYHEIATAITAHDAAEAPHQDLDPVMDDHETEVEAQFKKLRELYDPLTAWDMVSHGEAEGTGRPAAAAEEAAHVAQEPAGARSGVEESGRPGEGASGVGPPRQETESDRAGTPPRGDTEKPGAVDEAARAADMVAYHDRNFEAVKKNEPGLTRKEYDKRVEGGMKMLTGILTEPGAEGLPQTVIPGAEQSAEQAKQASTERQKAELKLRQQQSKIRKGGQESAGGMFAPERDQTDLLSQPTGDGTRAAPIKVTAPEHLDAASQQVNTAPTEAQKEAGNYAKGHINYQGMDGAIETPKGAIRSGIGADGKRWENPSPAAYGYIKGVIGADKDHLDAYFGPNPNAKNAYVIDQVDHKTGKFDEHKPMLGFDSKEEAIATYEKAFSDGKGKDRIGGVKEMPMPQFKLWTEAGNLKNPASGELKARPMKPEAPKAAGDTKKIGNLEKGAKSEWAEIGKNRDGHPLYEDQRGVRSYVENGIRHTEPVHLRVAKGGVEYMVDRSPDNKDWTPEATTSKAAETAKPKPPSEMTLKEIEDRTDELSEKIGQLKKGSPEHGAVSNEMQRLMQEHSDRMQTARAGNGDGEAPRKTEEQNFRDALHNHGQADRNGKTYWVSSFRGEDGAMRYGVKIGPKSGTKVWDGENHATKAEAHDHAVRAAFESKPAESAKTPATAAVKGSESKLSAHVLADRVAHTLGTAQETITAKDLHAMAEDVYGKTLASGELPREEMYDAAELGLNKYIAESPKRYTPATGTLGARQIADRLEALKNRMPTQTVRAGEKEEMQQFSTPPDYSYAAAWTADIKPTDVVLEPSAGTGGLLVHALNAGAREVHGNELSDRRAGMLRELNPTGVTQENAEHIDAILHGQVRPTVILMNPPFSNSAGRGIVKDTMIGAQHVEAALRLLAPGGRLVAIVGGGMKPGTPTFKKWWDRIGKEYDVRANVGVDGDIYRKYGTTFPTRLLVIDKVNPSGRAVLSTEGLKTAKDIIEALEHVAANRPAQSLATEPSRPQVAGEGQGAARPQQPVSGSTRDVGPGKGPADKPAGGVAGRPGGTAIRPPESEGQGAGVPLAPDESQWSVPGGTDVDPGVGAGKGKEPIGSGGGGAGDGIRPDGSGQRVKPGLTEAPETIKAAEDSLKPEVHDAPITEAVYEPYKPRRVKIDGSKAHPGPLVQSAAMASVDAPKVTHALAIPRAVITRGELSDAQLEAVAYAGDAHAQILAAEGDEPSRRRGFFIGDGTGVGKGREIAGIMLDNWMHGRKKHVWVSERQRLVQAAKRDWSGVLQNPGDVIDHSSVKAGDAIKQKTGILFTTYDTVKSGEKVRKEAAPGKVLQSRVDQIVKWLGEDFDGVIAFDEAHNLGNSQDSQGNRGTKKAAAKALAGIELQKRLPNARVVYVSATGATEVSNLAYADRLGLWGRGTAFANRNDFLAKVGKGGIAAMELVARDMKALGHYIARNLSYDGVEYDRVEHKLTKEQRQTYDKLAEAWQIVLKNFHVAMERSGITETDENGRTRSLNAQAKSNLLSQFWGGHQRFFNQVITSMQMPTVLKAIEKDIKEGRQVVLQLVNTNEAQQERALEKARAEDADEDALEDLDMSPKDQLMQMVKDLYPVQRFEEYQDEESGNIRTRPAVDAAGNPIEDPALVAARERLLVELGSIRAPEAPLDLLLNHFGTENVAEVTGRKQRVVKMRDPETGQMKTVVEKRNKSANLAEAASFQDAKKKILFFTNAGGTGSDYHAAIGTPSANARRSHYLLQPGWVADKAVQGLGRTHRTNQASAPFFHLVTTDLPGQKRFVSSIARRLGQLGALTKGERRTGNQGLFGLRDNLESGEATTALNSLFRDAIAGKIEGLSPRDLEQQMGIKLIDPATGAPYREMPEMTQVLNRMLSLKSDMQDKVFAEFSGRLDEIIDRAAAAGTLDNGVETYKADKIKKVSDRVVYTDPTSGAETRHVQLEASRRTHPTQFEQVLDRLKKMYMGGQPQFVISQKSGKIFGVATTVARTDPNGRIVEQKRLIGPMDYQFIDESALANKQNWLPAKGNDAHAQWDAQVAKVPEFATSDLHLITGAVLPIWDRLGGSPRVYRLQTDAGERMLGRVIPNDSVDTTLKALGAAEGKKVDVTPAQLADRVLKHGDTAILSNGWKIKRSRVANEPRLELVGPDLAFLKQLEADGVFTETIDWRTRFFIPSDAKAAAVLAKVLDGRPVTDLVRKGEGDVFQLPPEGWGTAETETPDSPKGVTRSGVPMDVQYHGDVVFHELSEKGKALVTEVNKTLARIVPKANVRAAQRITVGNDRVLGATVHGVVSSRGGRRTLAWSLQSDDVVGTGRHESVHWLKAEGYISPEDWATLEKAAEDRDWVKETGVFSRYRDSSHPVQLEEAIAEKVGQWRRGDYKGFPQPIRRILAAIDLILRRIAAAVRRVLGRKATVSDIFTNIETGRTGRGEPRAAAGGGGGATPPNFQRPKKGGKGQGSLPLPSTAIPVGEHMTALEDKLYRIRTNNEADSLEMLKWLKTMPKEVRAIPMQEKFYRHQEEGTPLTPEEQANFDRYIKPLLKQGTDTFNRIQKSGYPVSGDGYIHRIVVGKGSMYDQEPAGARSSNAYGERRMKAGSKLSKTAPSMKNRTVFMADGDQGGQQVIRGEDYGPGDTFTDHSTGEAFTVRQATTTEIEENTDLRYYKNALVNSMDNLLRLRRAERSIQFLEELKQDPTFLENATAPNSNRDPNDTAEWRTTALPQLAGWRMNPRLANLFDDFYGRPTGLEEALDDTLGRLNHAIVSSIFFNPVSAILGHGSNVLAHWYVSRGYENFMPQTFARSMANGMKAARDVWNLSPEYRRMMREGAALQYGPVFTRKFHETMLEAMHGEMQKNPQKWLEIAQAAGTTVKAIFSAIQGFGNKGLWFLNDVLLLQRVYDLRSQGMRPRDAIHEAERGIPNYRIPTEAWEGTKGRAFAKIMSNPNITIFGRYRYGMIKAYAETLKDLKGPKDQRYRAIGQLLALVSLIALSKLANYGLQQATGNENAEFRAAGPLSIPVALGKNMTTGEKTFSDAMGGLFALAPGFGMSIELGKNQDWKGDEIYNSGGSMGEIAKELGYYGLSQITPVDEALTILRGRKTPAETIGNWFQARTPEPEQVNRATRARQQRTREGTRRFERNVERPIRQGLGIE